ncbi:signal recognition particle protein, partial [bacterium]|nr:signal recognition particle protein [bacterium]
GTIKRQEAIINSMTKEERKSIEIINGQRRKRIAMGSGTHIQDVNLLIKNFIASRKMLKGLMKQGGMMGKRGLFPGM